MKFIGLLVGCLAFIALYVGLGLLAAWGIEWSWNIAIPAIFHGPRIDFGEAFAIYFLFSLISGLSRTGGKS